MLWVQFSVALGVIEGLKIQLCKTRVFHGVEMIGFRGRGLGGSIFSGNVSVASCKRHHLISEESRWWRFSMKI